MNPIIARFGRKLISDKAYELWKSNGCPEGRDEEFWFQAENELCKDNEEIANFIPFGHYNIDLGKLFPQLMEGKNQ